MKTALITIQGANFNAPQPYDEGHVLTVNEASALNQVFAENLRNNFAARIKRSAEETPPKVLTQEDFDKYAQDYKFGERTGGGRVSMDPVEREARNLAETAIKSKMREKGTVLKTVTNMEELIDGALAKYPKFREQAALVVAARTSAVGDLDL